MPHAMPTLVSSSRRAAEVMSVVGLTTTGDSVMTSATLHRGDKTVFEASFLAYSSQYVTRRHPACAQVCPKYCIQGGALTFFQHS